MSNAGRRRGRAGVSRFLLRRLFKTLTTNRYSRDLNDLLRAQNDAQSYKAILAANSRQCCWWFERRNEESLECPLYICIDIEYWSIPFHVRH